jgi:hypothetical protein
MTSTLAMVALATTLEGWVAANVTPAERVLCQHESKGEYFFVARAGDDDKLKLGSRVDLSGYQLETFSISVSWRLQDESGRSLTPKIAPTRVRNELLRGGGKTFAESVELQSVNVGSPPKRLRARVAVVKCSVHPCSKDARDAARYVVRVCETSL